MFYVYVLHSLADAGLYIGFTANLRKRTLQHKAGEAFATSYRGPWRLIYYEAYLDRQDALGTREIPEERLRSQISHETINPLLPKQFIPDRVSAAGNPACFYADNDLHACTQQAWTRRL